MSTNTARNYLGWAAVLGSTLAFASSAAAVTSGDNGSHDPSRMIESEGRVYIYSTGGGAKSSADGQVWKNEPTPTWNRNLLANNQGIWAPDGIFLNNQYYLYGSMWSSNKSSALILLTTPTLNPSSPKYQWTDQGVVVAGPAGVTHSCIDPAPVLDAEGNLWVVWGGGYPFNTTADSIFVTRLDNKTGLPLTDDSGYKPPNSPGHAIAQGHKEGPYVYAHGGNYFLWYQTGSCCEGTSSGYVMHVSRAPAITGPYSGDRVFYGSSGDIHGPGHIGIYKCGSVERFSYHYYPSNGSIIGVNSLSWGSDGWPVAGGQVTTGLTLPCSSNPQSPTDVGGAAGSDAGGAGVGGGIGSGVSGGADVSTGGVAGSDGPSVGVIAGGGSDAGNTAGSDNGVAGAIVVAGAPPMSTAGAPAQPAAEKSDESGGCSLGHRGRAALPVWGSAMFAALAYVARARRRSRPAAQRDS